MITGKFAGNAVALFGVAIANEAFYSERFQIDLVKPLFHRGVVDFVPRIGEVPGIRSKPPEHIRRLDHTNFFRGINEIGTDQQLIGFAVYHPIGRRPTNAAFENDFFKIRSDLIQLIRRPTRRVRCVGDGP